jgi:hypothetical protein
MVAQVARQKGQKIVRISIELGIERLKMASIDMFIERILAMDLSAVTVDSAKSPAELK